MKQVLRNIYSFMRKEPQIFGISIMCVFISAFLLNFSYGLYQNYHVMKEEAEIDMKQIDIEINFNQDESLLTKKILCQYLEALPNGLLDEIEIIAVSAKHPPMYPIPPEYGEDGYQTFYYRFCIRNGRYTISFPTKESWEKNGMIVRGRYILPEEEMLGEKVALISNYQNSGYSAETASRLCSEDSIKLWGEDYKVVGEYSGGWDTPIVPFLATPEDTRFNSLSMVFTNNITNNQYDELLQTAAITAPNIFKFPALDLPDADQYYLYNNVMLISVMLCVLSALNFAMLFQYILQKRKQTLAIFRMCGCTIGKAIRLYLGECLLISIPVYGFGFTSFYWALHHFLYLYFPYMEASYSPTIYTAIFSIYLSITILILGIMIYNTIRHDVINEWRN